MAQIAMAPPSDVVARVRNRLAEAPSAPKYPPELIARLRELRTEVQDLQSVLTSIQQGDATLPTYTQYFQRTIDDVNTLFATIDTITKDLGSPEADMLDILDALRHLHNLWEQITVCPILKEPGGTYDSQTLLHHLNMLDGEFRALVFQIGILTIPPRLNEWLKNARPGYYIPFHSVFDDELPTYEDRVKVLNYLAWSPKVIKGGLVDVATGLIYRYSRHWWGLMTSALATFFALVLATLLVLGSSYVHLSGWTINAANRSLLLMGWGALLVGVIVHVAVSTAKRMRDQSGYPPVIASGDFLLILNAKIGPFLLKLLLALVGFFGLIFAVGASKVTVGSFFLVGYSLDSFVELLTVSIEQRATTQVSALKQQLGGE